MSRRAADVRADQARAQSLSSKFSHGDNSLEAWAARLQADADRFIANKQPDPLDQFLR